LGAQQQFFGFAYFPPALQVWAITKLEGKRFVVVVRALHLLLVVLLLVLVEETLEDVFRDDLVVLVVLVNVPETTTSVYALYAKEKRSVTLLHPFAAQRVEAHHHLRNSIPEQLTVYAAMDVETRYRHSAIRVFPHHCVPKTLFPPWISCGSTPGHLKSPAKINFKS